MKAIGPTKFGGPELDARALPAVADGGDLVTLKGWTGPSERGIVIHPSLPSAQLLPAAVRTKGVRHAPV